MDNKQMTDAILYLSFKEAVLSYFGILSSDAMEGYISGLDGEELHSSYK